MVWSYLNLLNFTDLGGCLLFEVLIWSSFEQFTFLGSIKIKSSLRLHCLLSPDALLNELHETNVEILKRNKSSDAFADSRNAQSDKPKPKSIPIPPTETDLDAVSNPSTSSPSASTKLFRETSRTTDSSGMQYDWGAILDTLDRSDYTGMSNGYSYPPNGMSMILCNLLDCISKLWLFCRTQTSKHGFCIHKSGNKLFSIKIAVSTWLETRKDPKQIIRKGLIFCWFCEQFYWWSLVK